MDRTRHVAGYVERSRRFMALQALAVVGDEAWTVRRLLVERVEDAGFAGRGRGDFEDRSASHPADVDVVVEVERARRLRPDQPELGRCLGEDKSLRRDGDV